MKLVRFFNVLLSAVVLLSVNGCTAASDNEAGKAKYIFLFIGDGMGITQVAAADSYLAYTNGDQLGGLYLTMTSLPHFGLLTSYSANSRVTDSAAAGTAIACGVKTNNGSIGVDAQGNPVDDGIGGILTYYNPIVPGQPNIFLLGEFAYGEHPWGYGMGYYNPLFDEEGFIEDYYGSGGPSPRQMDETSLNEADYWTGYYSKTEFKTLEPSVLDASFNVQMKLTPKGGKVEIYPDDEIMQYVFMAIDQYTYDMLLPYLNNDPSLFQWYTTSYNAMMMLGAGVAMGDMVFNLEEIFWDTLTFSAKGSSTMFRPANEISAVSRDPFVEIGSFTIWTMIICPGVSTFSMRPSFSRILPGLMCLYIPFASVLGLILLTNSSNASKYRPRSR